MSILETAFTGFVGAMVTIINKMFSAMGLGSLPWSADEILATFSTVFTALRTWWESIVPPAVTE